MIPKEELTKLLIDSYDKGVEDVKQEAIIALEKTVAVMVAAEREACAKVADAAGNKYGWGHSGNDVDTANEIAAAIRARGTT